VKIGDHWIKTEKKLIVAVEKFLQKKGKVSWSLQVFSLAMSFALLVLLFAAPTFTYMIDARQPLLLAVPSLLFPLHRIRQGRVRVYLQ